MFRQFAFFKRAVVAANLLWVPFNSPVNLSHSVPAPIRVATRQDARPAGRPAVRTVSDRPACDPAPAGDGRNSVGRGLPSYTGGLTEEQMRALD
jgi:hypothetical protein